MSARTAFVYTDSYFEYDYGPDHPLRVERLRLTHDLIRAYGLLDLPDMTYHQTEPATQEQVLSHHRPEYVDVLKKCGHGRCPVEEAVAFGIGPGDNPVFNGLWEWSLLTTGASIMCGRLVAEGRADIAFNMAGGLHHAMAGRAAGFCYVNDAVIVIKDLVSRGLRVAYVDIDAHHGDGVQAAFYDTDEVLTVSLHQHGRTLFPGTGFVFETGRGRGQGYSANAPLMPGTDDELFLTAFKGLVPDLLAAFRPDILVTQLGVDTFRTDPLTNLCLTNNGFLEAVRTFKGLGLPWVALGGGGYHLVNVARAWTLAWAVMNGEDPPDKMPDSFIQTIRPLGYREELLRDDPLTMQGAHRAEAAGVVREVVETLRRTILPVVAHDRGRT
ncbi:MAG: acetoin utilization protein AcuC [Proteobacteria bacterium]|nr:acetoin utilization protein AcuC [Pseudomonadota bacterium]